MEHIREILSRHFIGANTIADWCWFGVVLLLGLILRTVVARLITRIIFGFFKRKKDGVHGHQTLFQLLKKPWNLLLLLITIFIASQQVTWPLEWKMTPPTEFGIRMTLDRLLLLGIEIAFTWLLLRLTDFFGMLLHERAGNTPGKSDDQLVPFLRESIKVVIVIISTFFMLGSIFHVNVASLIAGLGIGGIAIALAAKESLENLLASFTIFLDKPFVVGDVIQHGEKSGTIEKIGFRSTRIRMEDRSLVTLPNRKLVENEVVNLSLRTARRLRFTIGLRYSTSAEQVRKIVSDIHTYIEQHPQTSFQGENQVHLFGFGQSSIDVQVTCYIPDLDFDLFLKTKEEINFAIMEIVAKNGSAFAFPSMSVYMENK
jgi:MscS family membrane protein